MLIGAFSESYRETDQTKRKTCFAPASNQSTQFATLKNNVDSFSVFHA